MEAQGNLLMASSRAHRAGGRMGAEMVGKARRRAHPVVPVHLEVVARRHTDEGAVVGVAAEAVTLPRRTVESDCYSVGPVGPFCTFSS